MKLREAAFLPALLVLACSSKDDDTIPGANLATINVTEAVTRALVGKPFAFLEGVPAFGGGQSTTLTFDSESAARLTQDGKTASMSVRYGSCVFTVNACDPACPAMLTVGSTITVQSCQLSVLTDDDTGSLALGTAMAPPTSIGDVEIRCSSSSCAVLIDKVQVAVIQTTGG